MIPKKLAPAKAGVADFSDKIMRKIKENREHFRFNLIEKRSKESPCQYKGRCNGAPCRCPRAPWGGRSNRSRRTKSVNQFGHLPNKLLQSFVFALATTASQA